MVLEVPHNARRYRGTDRGTEGQRDRETKYKLLYGD